MESPGAPSTSAPSNHKPRSWAEDLISYRTTRGSQAFSRLDQTEGVPARYCRTNYVPFCDTKHKMFPYNDFVDGKATGAIRIDDRIQQDRCARHGWGDTGLLKEEGYEGVRHPRGEELPTARPRAAAAPGGATAGRNGLFGVLQMTEAGGQDSWIGNGLIDPTKGKAAVSSPRDPKGRKDLFEVLQSTRPGVPADDSWMGNSLIDPARGKGNAPGPEQTRGRRDLTDIFTQSILHDPRRLELLNKGADPLGDAWCGNELMNPAVGRLAVAGSATQSAMHGSTFVGGAPPGSDFPRPHTRMVPPPVAESVPAILQGRAQGDDWGRLGRRPGDADTARANSAPIGATARAPVDMYANMTFKPLSDQERGAWGTSWDGGRSTGRKPLAAPGSADPAKGADLLAWKPDARVSSFVPRGGLAQEARWAKGTSRGPGPARGGAGNGATRGSK